MRSDIVKMYKDVHSWVGIIAGLALFIAFYAGSITMFEEPLKRWASPPSELAPPVSLAETPRLIEATLAAHPDAKSGYTVHIETGPEKPARMSWTAWPEGRRRGAPTETYSSGFAADGSVEVVKGETTEVAEFIDVLHQQVGLPFDHEISMPIMGVISLLYAIALFSGVIALWPSLVKDLFALRLGKNLKRMWLDVHNVLGLFSLPFHIIMALTAIVFAFHDYFYGLQNIVSYDGKIRDMFEANEPLHHVEVDPNTPFLSPADLIERMKTNAPGFELIELAYTFNRDGTAELLARGVDEGYGHRGPTFGLAMLNPYTGEIMSAEYLPGRQNGWGATVTGFFALHFGNFGGAAVRWGYFFLGLAGAFLFYTGNLLWIETRRKKSRKGAEVTQSRSSHVLGALTVGVSLGCIAGISLTVAAAKALPSLVENPAAWHSGIYYTAFVAAVGWAFFRGAARGSVELLIFAAVATALIPVVSIVSLVIPGFGWNHGGAGSIVDLTAALGAGAFLFLAHKTALLIKRAPIDSIWHAAGASVEAPQVASGVTVESVHG